jgi:5'-nucleotidase
MERPLILATNDDGIESAGLWAMVEALLPLGEVLVVAPDRQWSGAGRSVPQGVSGRITEVSCQVDGRRVTAYAVDASPAQAVIHALLELVPRFVSLVVSGINFGANLSIEVTVSGTVGAALEAAAFGIPALAISQEMDPAYHLVGKQGEDYAAARAFTRRFAQHLLKRILPYDVDVLNINIPDDATPHTPWRFTRLSRNRYFLPMAPNRERSGERKRIRYRVMANPWLTEPESDIRAVAMDRIVSVTPLSLDLTSRLPVDALNKRLRVGRLLGMEVDESLFIPLPHWASEVSDPQHSDGDPQWWLN